MPRQKLPPRLYLDPQRRVWVIRYEEYFKRTRFTEDRRSEAEAALKKILLQSSWVRGVRRFQPNLRGAARHHRAGTVYFLSKDGCAEYPIKIGFCAGSLERRLIDIQTGNPHRLALLASFAANYPTEQKLLERLKEHRLEGEWFQRSALVLEALGAAQAGKLGAWIAS